VVFSQTDAFSVQDGYLKFNALPHWQPVELSQYWRDMLTLENASNEARGSILDSLKTLNKALSNTGQQ